MSKGPNQPSVLISCFAAVLILLTLVSGICALLPPTGVVPTEYSFGETKIQTTSTALVVMVACPAVFLALIGFAAKGGIVLHDVNATPSPWYVRHKAVLMFLAAALLILGLIGLLIYPS